MPSLSPGRASRGLLGIARMTESAFLPRLSPTGTLFGPPPSARRHRFLHRRHQLAEREGLRQERELLVLRQALLEGILRITRNEDDPEVGIAAAHGLEQGRDRKSTRLNSSH